MTVRTRIMTACLIFMGICGVVGLSAWQSQERLSGLAMNLYDRAFVSQDFLGRANVLFESFVARHGAGAASVADRQEALPEVVANVDIAITCVRAAKTLAVLQRLRRELAALPSAQAGQVGSSLAQISADFALGARRLSNNGLAQRDAAEASAASTRLLLLVVMGVALAAAAATGGVLTRSVAPPLRQAAADMMRLCRGDTDGVVAGLDRHDEIGDLCRSIGVFRQALLDNRVQSVRFQAALDNMTQGLCLFDAQGCLVVHNPRFAAMFGAPVTGATASMLLADTRIGDLFGPPAATQQDGRDEQAHELPDGRVIGVSRQTIPGAGWVATYEDVTERRHAQDKLSHMARHDALTGLPNRVKFREHMDQVLSRTPRAGNVAVLYLDLDGFKIVNDTLGHPVGDELLRAVAIRLQDSIGENEMVARLGGDEFAVIQVHLQQLVDMTVLSDRLVQAMQAPFDIYGHRIVIGTSIGLALGDEASTSDMLLRNADIALYRAKAGGRGTWRLFRPEMDAELQAHRKLEIDLQGALADGQFEVFYQPLIEAVTETLIGFEALLRWNHPERGMVPPSEFIPLAEELGLIGEVGVWVLDQACKDAAEWPSHVKLAVNLSPAQFVKGDLMHDVEHALAKSGLGPGRLELEITESVLLQDSVATLATLHRLRGLGVRISLDDFGTGYSSLSYLRQFPFDKIKIDQSFVSNAGATNGSVEIIRAIVGLGKALNMAVLAEGVETAEQLRMLQAEGCDEVQGYLFSKPKPLRELPSIISVLSTQRAKSRYADARRHSARLSLVAGQS